MSVSTFFRGVRTELKHVKWPTRAQTVASTVFVVIAALAVAYYLGLLDIIFAAILRSALVF